ncbi:MAG: antitoxin family protein [Pirellulales bacterium]
MSQEFDAIYERGVFRPLEPVELAEQTKVHVQIEEAGEDGPGALAGEASAQRVVLRELLGWVHSQPSSPTDERVSARDDE